MYNTSHMDNTAGISKVYQELAKCSCKKTCNTRCKCKKFELPSTELYVNSGGC